MSQLLRRPNAVPALFSRGSDQDDHARKSDRLISPVARRLEALVVAVGLDGEETVFGRGGRVLAGSSIAIFVIGLPLMEATKLVVAMSLAH